MCYPSLTRTAQWRRPFRERCLRDCSSENFGGSHASLNPKPFRGDPFRMCVGRRFVRCLWPCDWDFVVRRLYAIVSHSYPFHVEVLGGLARPPSAGPVFHFHKGARRRLMRRVAPVETGLATPVSTRLWRSPFGPKSSALPWMLRIQPCESNTNSPILTMCHTGFLFWVRGLGWL